jgi:hypothetical protein
MKSKSASIAIATLAITMGGCTSVQLKHDTRSFAATISDTYEAETLENLALFIEHPHGMPSLADLTAGSVEADASFSPSLTIPFGNQVQTVVATEGQTITAPSRSFTLGGTVGRKVTLGVSPVVDAIRLRNTAAIYRYVLSDEPDSIAAGKLMTSYHFPMKTASTGETIIDEAYLRRPQCVLCYSGSIAKPGLEISQEETLKNIGAFTVNPELKKSWLHPVKVCSDDHDLGPYGKYELWATNAAYTDGYLSDLVMILLPAGQPSGKSGS